MVRALKNESQKSLSYNTLTRINMLPSVDIEEAESWNMFQQMRDLLLHLLLVRFIFYAYICIDNELI